MKNSQKGFAITIVIAVVALLVIGGGVYIYSNKKAEAPKLEEIKNESNKFILPDGWNYTNSGGDDFVLLKSSKNNDSIEIKYFDNLDIFKTDNGKFGKLTLKYSETQKCWLLSQYNAKSGYGESCAEPTGKTLEGNQYFKIYNGYSYVVIKSSNSFVLFNLIGDDRDSLELIAKNIFVDGIIENISTTEIKNQATNMLSFEDKWKKIQELTPYLSGASFICNSEANCPGVVNAIQTQKYDSCDSLGIYVAAYRPMEDGQNVIITKLEKNPSNQSDINSLEEYKKLCKSFVAIINGDITHNLNEVELSGLYSLNNDIEGCHTLNTYNQSCLRNIALIYGDENICLNENAGFENKNICYTNIAISNKDEKFCESVNDTVSKRSCYVRVAKITNNPDLCNMVPYTKEEYTKLSSGPIYDGSEITMCFMDIAKRQKRLELCDRIDEFDKNMDDLLTKACKGI